MHKPQLDSTFNANIKKTMGSPMTDNQSLMNTLNFDQAVSLAKQIADDYQSQKLETKSSTTSYANKAPSSVLTASKK